MLALVNSVLGFVLSVLAFGHAVPGLVLGVLGFENSGLDLVPGVLEGEPGARTFVLGARAFVGGGLIAQRLRKRPMLSASGR